MGCLLEFVMVPAIIRHTTPWVDLLFVFAPVCPSVCRISRWSTDEKERCKTTRLRQIQFTTAVCLRVWQ